LRVVQNHDAGNLPDELSFLKLATRDAINAFRLTALKRAEDGDGVVIRFFNTLEQATSGELQTWWEQEGGAVQTNLNEEEQQELATTQGIIRIPARQKEIITLKVKTRPRLLLDVSRGNGTRLLPPLAPAGKTPTALAVKLPPVITQQEVQAEVERVKALEEALLRARAEVFTLEDAIERTGSRAVSQLYELQKKKMEVATLTRQRNEARISELLNRQLNVSQRIEDELEEIGEAMSWSRTKKRAGEYLLHYYETLLKAESSKPKSPAPQDSR
jgi:hypothetical protein